MKNFCPECGAKLEKEYRFCPNCGSQLNVEQENLEIKDADQSENSVDKEKKVYCKNCGEENDADAVICSSCGIKLDSAGNKSNKQKRPAGNKKTGKGKKVTPIIKDKKPAEKGTKTLNTRMFLIVSGAIFIIAAIIIISSGVLNNPSVNVESSNQSNANMPSVDLNSINKINELEAELKKSPNNTDLRLQLAHTQNDAGFYDKAIEDYKKYLEVKPKDADARIDMGVCYYNLGNYPAAIDEMQKALKYEPNHQIGNLNLGIVNLAAGNLEKSKEWLEKAVEINPNSDAGKRAEELLKSHENSGGN